MSKQIPLSILLTNWIVGLLFVLLAPTSVEAAPSFEGKSYVQTSQGLVSDSFNLPDGPPLEVDLEFFQSPELFRNSSYLKSAAFAVPYSEYGSVPLFDVKQTFIHFFFSW